MTTRSSHSRSTSASSSSSSHKHEHHCPYVPKPQYCAPQEGDSRSPCPALNTLANHGYLPRDGKCITPEVLMKGLREGYHLSAPLAWVLVQGGFYLLGQRRKRICLHDLARHNAIEHNASLVHPDVEPRDEYAPIDMHERMLEDLLAFASASADGFLMTHNDVARARVAREAEYLAPMDRLHAEIARGEMAIVLNLFNNPDPAPGPAAPPKTLLGKLKRALRPAAHRAPPLPGVPTDLLRVWMHQERLPDGWRPYHKTGLLRVVHMSSKLRATMNKLQEEQKGVLAARRKTRAAESELAEAEREEEALEDRAAADMAGRQSLALNITASPAHTDIEIEQGSIGDAPLSEPRVASPDSAPPTTHTRASSFMTLSEPSAPSTPITAHPTSPHVRKASGSEFGTTILETHEEEKAPYYELVVLPDLPSVPHLAEEAAFTEVAPILVAA
ncbi:hypothetical protein WOLCODRAFT_137592 [Wolfiporia cocos MD-104 SS10]|uniref:Heme haloperoxidase family profile domain-containing protein n=1 Tax=Wolfiporia cocos (strain MD-104) TaxID=742152 RepID=A0A2H3JSM9_WOLCO|nr:hypothetical protein WOLCODRAFT_137592 [Wolfiporia cocos MD-104 SS10]